MSSERSLSWSVLKLAILRKEAKLIRRLQSSNFNYPFPTNPPFVPSENPIGLYETDFSVPNHWQNNALYRLRFEGVDSAYHVWVNGKKIGYSQGSRNAAEFDISNVIRKDEGNTLRVKVYQWSDGSYIEDQDMWVSIPRDSFSILDTFVSRKTCFGVRKREKPQLCYYVFPRGSTLCLENGMLTSVLSLVAVRSVLLGTCLRLSDLTV